MSSSALKIRSRLRRIIRTIIVIYKLNNCLYLMDGALQWSFRINRNNWNAAWRAKPKRKLVSGSKHWGGALLRRSGGIASKKIWRFGIMKSSTFLAGKWFAFYKHFNSVAWFPLAACPIKMTPCAVLQHFIAKF